jgi:hypothetical protein
VVSELALIIAELVLKAVLTLGVITYYAHLCSLNDVFSVNYDSVIE